MAVLAMGVGFCVLGFAWAAVDPGRFVTVEGSVVKTALHDQGERGTSVRVLFSYPFQGQTYESTIAPELNEPFSSNQDALNRQAEYWPGRTLKVYVDPDRPREGTTQPSRWRKGHFVVIVGALVALGGLMIGRGSD